MRVETVIYPLLKHVLLGPAMRVAFRPKVTGLHNVPRSGPVILAANHLAVLDSFVLPLVVPRQVFFLGKQEYFVRPGAVGRMQATFFHGAGAIPVDRSGGRAALAALQECARVLERGDVLAMHPEGTRSPDGRIYRGRIGVARLALRTGAAVVPVALDGTDLVQPRGTVVPRPRKISIRIGEAMHFSDTRGATHRDATRAVTNEIMQAIQKLSGRPYVDEYAPSSSHAL
ncbi:lysophospholipid acyltransferase family protein [Sinosporangium siamense]|uniref:1-acyl-sn-glycerol-3-phosphate acyltransferase n=1 Tax=Sinosporangium siamense TaxID=1367973 RepID=A0A919RMU7_9ACTN|nr:lysophospholipid acyltransferase family protein [Sinosporangium siamense]GII96681.1 1-acyl-sn-glycerol-3-phosphate acyltransferase [Sinosporangium siamense]